MARSKAKDIEVTDIRDDLESLKTHIIELISSLPTNVIELTRQLQEDSAERAAELTENVRKSTVKAANAVVAQGEEHMRAVERTIKANPGKSLLAAFATGIVASMFLGPRRK